MKCIVRVAAVVLLSLAATACGDDDEGGDPSVAVDRTTTTGETPTGSTASLSLVASGIAFDKASLTTKANQPMTLTLTNNDTVNHNVTIEELDIDKDATPAEAIITDPITPAAGTYEYFCKFHPAAMRGELVVN